MSFSTSSFHLFLGLPLFKTSITKFFYLHWSSFSIYFLRAKPSQPLLFQEPLYLLHTCVLFHKLSHYFCDLLSVLPLTIRSILILVVSNFLSSSLFKVQHSRYHNVRHFLYNFYTCFLAVLVTRLFCIVHFITILH